MIAEPERETRRPRSRTEAAAPLPRPAPPRPGKSQDEERRPMARKGTRVARRAQELPALAAFLAASFVVSLGAIYIAAYARVCTQGLEQAHLRTELRAAERRRDDLNAQISNLTLATRVKTWAANEKLEPNTSENATLLVPPRL